MSLSILTLLFMAGTWAALIVLIRWPMDPPIGQAAFKGFLLAGGVMLTWRETSGRVLAATSPHF